MPDTPLVARRTAPVALPAGGTAYVRTATLGEIKALKAAVRSAGPDADETAVVRGAELFACAEDGRPLFGPDLSPDDVPLEVLTALFDAGAEINGFTRKAIDQGKDESPATTGSPGS